MYHLKLLHDLQSFIREPFSSVSSPCVRQREQSEKLLVRNYYDEVCACINVLTPSCLQNVNSTASVG